MSTFITRLETAGTGPRVAVKDLIDVEGVPTTAGCRAVERSARPATRDATCLAGARAAGARLVGKANLHELAMLPLGTNPWFGTPVNPLDPALIPGGSSSGSAVAVANDDADVALGSDTGGSVRIPAACCGITGLKTTHGRISTDGVWPLAPSLDTIGPMATSVAGLALGMELLEPGFAPSPTPARRIGRLRTSGLPELEAAVDAALQAAELEVVALDWDGFDAGGSCFTAIGVPEFWESDHELVESNPDAVGADIVTLLGMVEAFRSDSAQLGRQLSEWKQSLFALFDQVELLALPTMPILPPRIEDITPETFLPIVLDITRHVSLFNAAGVPCSAQPVPAAGLSLPGSLQLVGPLGSEEVLLATAAVVEAAAGWTMQ
jgi:amidase